MPKKDLWVEISDPDPATFVGSAGSCDSIISNNSSSSEMNNHTEDYLSVAEKECLMFLEETLDSLDAEADSGISTDETEASEPSKHPRTWPTRDVPKELDHENLGKQKRLELKDHRSVPDFAPSAGHYSLPRNICVRESPLIVNSRCNTNNLKDLPQTCLTSWESPKHEAQQVQNAQANMNINLKVSDLESVVIPPPQPFQDNTESHLRREKEPVFLNKVSKKDAGSMLKPHFEVRHADMVVTYDAVTAQKELLPDEKEIVSRKETVTKLSSPKNNKKNSEQMIDAHEDDKNLGLEEPLQDSHFKQGPPTAPKPRKLPPNIILKTSKTNVVSLKVDPNHKIKVLPEANGRPRASTGDFSMEKPHSLPKEQERARREALEKLGLPLDKEKCTEDQVTKAFSHSKPKETSKTSSRENINIDVTYNKRPEQQNKQVGGKGIYSMEKNIQDVKNANFKSITLERSGVGLSSYISTGNEFHKAKNSNSTSKASFLDKITPSFLRSSRPRPASLGMGKDFVDLKENQLHDVEMGKSDKQRSYPLQQSSKLPRPPCTSVKITPRGATEEHRREALKKLGLLKE